MLSVLGYHRAVLAVVRRLDERAWMALLGGPVDGIDDALLRHAYRLEPGAHPAVYRAGERAAEALELDAEIDYFQVGGEPNAAYIHQPGKAVILFQGALLDRLDEDELTAVSVTSSRTDCCGSRGRRLSRRRPVARRRGRRRAYAAQYLETHVAGRWRRSSSPTGVR